MGLKSSYKIYELPPVSKDKLDTFYKNSDLYLTELSKHDDQYLKNYINFVNKYADINQRILDLGCGNGRSTYLISTLNKNIVAVGCDISYRFLSSLGQGKGDAAKYCTADASKLPFADQSMDIVSCFQLIEHISEPDKVISEMIRVVKKGGLIIILSPNLFSPFPVIRMLWEKYFRRKGHNSRGDIFIRPVAFFRNISISLKKIISKEVKFLFRNPDLSNDYLGNDSDSIYLANQIDIKKFLESKGLKVINTSYGMSFMGRLAARLFPDFSGEMGIVARRPV